MRKDIIKKDSFNYLSSGKLKSNPAWFSIPVEQKLSFIQFTPDSQIKSRPVGKDDKGNVVSAPYVEIGYVERALNFVSNFQWGAKITDKGMKEIKTPKTTIYEAYVVLDCWIFLGDRKIEKEVVGTAKNYKNPATPSYEVYKVARANGVKHFARELGIGADKREAENEAIRKSKREFMAEDWKDDFVVPDVKQGDSEELDRLWDDYNTYHDEIPFEKWYKEIYLVNKKNYE